MRSVIFIFFIVFLSQNIFGQKTFAFGGSTIYSRTEWNMQLSPTNTDGNRVVVGWLKGSYPLNGDLSFVMNTDTVRFGRFTGPGNSILGIGSGGAIFRANTYSFIDTNFLATRNWSGLNFQQKLNGTTTQYVRGNGTMATMPTDNASFTNGAGYITSYVETDPVWSGVALQYRTKAQNDILYQPAGSYLTLEVDPVYSASSWFGTTNNSVNWNTAYSNRISMLTTTGNSGTSTFTGNTLNIPNYTLVGLGGQSQLSGNGFVKVTGATISYDNSTYSTSSDLSTGLATKENSIVTGTTSQYWRGDKTFQTLDKTVVGLTNVDNTSDVNKPVSTATQTALNGKQGNLTVTNTGTSGNATLVGGTLNIPNYSATTNVGTDSRSGYGTGTAYSLTGSSAKITMGTTSPMVTLPSAGTYMIISNLKLDYAGLTTVGVSTSSFKLRRTNNTALDIPNASTSFTSTLATLLTGPAGDADMQGVLYTTSTAGDIIEMWGNRGINITVGNLNVSEAWIVAVRIY